MHAKMELWILTELGMWVVVVGEVELRKKVEGRLIFGGWLCLGLRTGSS